MKGWKLENKNTWKSHHGCGLPEELKVLKNETIIIAQYGDGKIIRDYLINHRWKAYDALIVDALYLEAWKYDEPLFEKELEDDVEYFNLVM